jgi:tRNA pseudouridine38-40 synthase
MEVSAIERIKIIFGYDGTDFYGYQVQPSDRTVQQEIDRALAEVCGCEIQTFASGRTDRGVHAVHQVAHFDVITTIPIDRLPKIINAKLPNDIVVKHAQVVPSNFHARFDVSSKTYCYAIDNQPIPDILQRRYSYHVATKLNVTHMKLAAEYLIGEHDFTSFCSQKTTVEDKVRTIYSINIRKSKNNIRILVTGNGFLYNMVRIIVGALIEVGKGRLKPIDIKYILETKDRTSGSVTAPAHGLILWDVVY